MLNKILLSLIIITSCVNAMEGKNVINNGLIENSSNNSKSVIFTKSNNINGIMNNEKTIKNNINIDKNERNKNKNILNTNTLNIEYEKNKDLSQYIINNFLDINALPEDYIINVNDCVTLLKQNKIVLAEKHGNLLKQYMGLMDSKKALDKQVGEIRTKVEKIQKAINSAKKKRSEELQKKLTEDSNINIEEYIKETEEIQNKITEVDDVAMMSDFVSYDFVPDNQKKQEPNENGKEVLELNEKKKQLNDEIEKLNIQIDISYKLLKDLESKKLETENCIKYLEPYTSNITAKDLKLKLKINYLIAQIHDKSETLRKLNEDRENTFYHRIVDPIQSFFNEIVFSDTESKEDFVNKLVSLVCNNKIKKNVTDKDLYNKFENDLRSTLKEFTKQNITKPDNIKKTDIKLDDQQSMNDQQFVEYLQAILDSLNNDEIPQMEKRANESSVTKLSKAVFNKLNTIPSSMIKNGAKILFKKYKDSSNDMEKNKDENNNSNKIQENNNAEDEQNKEPNKKKMESKKNNKNDMREEDKKEDNEIDVEEKKNEIKENNDENDEMFAGTLDMGDQNLIITKK